MDKATELKTDACKFLAMGMMGGVIIGIVVGLIIGCIWAHGEIWGLLNSAGIRRLVEHEITVDHQVVSNWVEIVWIEQKKENK